MTTMPIMPMAKACIAIWNFHHVNAVHYADEAWWQRDWHHAWHLARYVDHVTRDAIRFYLRTGRRWSQVNYDCGFTQN